MKVAFKTDVGRKRKNNEDNFYVDPRKESLSLQMVWVGIRQER
jgi:serine/threonine protein phosphatase PrpC